MASPTCVVGPEALRRFARANALFAIGLSSAALLGWLSGHEWLADWGTGTVPMAPNTAVASLILGVAVYLRTYGRSNAWGRAGAAAVAVIAGATILDRALGLGANADRWLVSTERALGAIPLGVMSKFTAVALGLLGVALALSWQRRTERRLAGLLASTSGALAAVFLLGYAYDAPLLGDSSEIPMAISTSTSFVFLTLAVVASGGSDVWPARRLLAASLEGQLLRAFVPVVLVAVVAEGLLISTVLAARPLGNPAVVAASVGVGSVMLLGLVATRIASRVAQTIEAAERRTRAARNSLLEEALARAQTEASLERTRSQLLHAQKLEPVAQLAGGIAHDFNNLLSVILAESDLLAGDQRLPADARETAGEVRAAAQVSASLTRQLLAFSRRQVMQRVDVDLNVLIADLATLIRRLVGPSVKLVTELDTDAGCVLADRSQLEQVLMNLAVNASQAMPAGGLLRITTQRVGERVHVTVSDTGIGMDSETLSRLFEPFFTTKESSRGTGLGLATVHGIVHQSGGSISAQSELGEGSAFDIDLPRRDPSLAVEERPMAPRVAAKGRGETVLLVDDDALVRRSTRRILDRHGFSVLEAQTGDEALALMESAENIAAVVTDLVMPGMSGAELARRLREQQPAVRLLFISGYAADTQVEREELGRAGAVLQKPFTPDSLLQKLHEVLDQRSALADWDDGLAG